MNEIKMKVHPTGKRETFLWLGYEGAFPIYYSRNRDKFYWQYVQEGKTIHLREVRNPNLIEKYRIMLGNFHGQKGNPADTK